MAYSENAPVLILREETDTRFGKNQIIRNIEMCEKVAGMVRSTLGPNGMDKMFFDGREMLITNDGATIMKSLDIVDPAAKVLLFVSESQDRDIGDGTTSVVLLTASILKSLKPLVREDFPVQSIVRSLEDALSYIEKKSGDQKISFQHDSLQMLAETSLNSKILAPYKRHFAEMVLCSLEARDEDVSVKKVSGGGVDSSCIIKGVAFEKCFTYAGYEQQPKRIVSPKIAVVSLELEWKSEMENGEMRISSADEYARVVAAEWKLITDQLDALIQAGANVVLSTLPVGDYATQYFAKHNVFSAGRVPEMEAQRVVRAFGGRIVSSVSLVSSRTLGSCALFEEREIGACRYNCFFSSTENAVDSPSTPASQTSESTEKTSTPEEILSRDSALFSSASHPHLTFILRGPGAEILAEVERSLHDSMAVTRRTAKTKEIVAGGGAFEMEISRELRDYATTIPDEGRFVVKALSEAFEIIPFQLARNFGHDAIHLIQILRKMHHEGLKYHGVSEGGTADSSMTLVVEPLEIKTHMIQAAISAASAILSIDATIVSGKK